MNTRREIFLETADHLGARLCRDAIWAGNRCNWVGPGKWELTGHKSISAERACGADLFSGTSGIALFLGRLYAVTGERTFSFTAEGAIRQALSRLDHFPASTRPGFFTGLTGISSVLIELSEIFDVSKFADMALLIMEEVSKDDLSQQGLDVVSGSAGIVVALLRIHRKHPQDLFLDLAIRHAEHLLNGDGKEIDSPTSEGGFARGSDGIAWALLELSGVTGSERFRQAAEKTFERARLDRHAASVHGAATQAVPALEATWFRGASGVGHTRLRAFELLGDEIYLQEAKAAMQVVRQRLTRLRSGTPEDFSLAYGTTGEAESLINASIMIEEDWHKDLAESVGLWGVESYRKVNLPWPCHSAGHAETPNLLLGIAGVGHFYLRLYDPLKTPSLLLWVP